MNTRTKIDQLMEIAPEPRHEVPQRWKIQARAGDDDWGDMKVSADEFGTAYEVEYFNSPEEAQREIDSMYSKVHGGGIDGDPSDHRVVPEGTPSDVEFYESVSESSLDAQLEKLGWFNIDTGGGCTAYQKTVDDAEFLIADQCEVPTRMDQVVDLSIHVDGNPIGFFEGMLCSAAVALVNRYRSF